MLKENKPHSRWVTCGLRVFFVLQSGGSAQINDENGGMHSGSSHTFCSGIDHDVGRHNGTGYHR